MSRAKEDSHYWRVETWARELQAHIARRHAEAGNVTVLMAPRRLNEDEKDAFARSGVRVEQTTQ